MMDYYSFKQQFYDVRENRRAIKAIMARLATLPRQQEWEDYMSEFQAAEKGASSDEKWRMMERIFHLYE